MKKLQLNNNIHYSLVNRVESVGYISPWMFPHWVRLLIWSLQLPKAPFKVFMARVLNLWKHSGSTFVVQYTKECTRVLQHFVSGNPVFVTNEMPVALTGGLPRIIPGVIRSRIRSGDPVFIRGALSLLSVYRVIKTPSKLKLETITDPFKGSSMTLPQFEIEKSLRDMFGRKPNIVLKLKDSINLSTTAGPNFSVAMQGILFDILVWRDSELLPTLKEYILLHKGGDLLWSLLEDEMNLLPPLKEGVTGYLGRLSIKEEAAGKARVFAITDSITQTVMKPLHKSLFRLLKELSTDGTFDQPKPLERLVELYHKGELGSNCEFYSYDLSAATDRLPISVQEQVLSVMIGPKLSSLWRSLLVNRDWVLRRKGFDPLPLRYSVGQPMGALSSWAMLAMTHHSIVRIAALRLGKTNFTHYALLGDDVVIADKAVALSYHYIMVEVLGVEINLSKSLISAHSFEFAKRLVTMENEVSAVGAKNLLVALKSSKGLPTILQDLANKGFPLSEELISSMFQKAPTLRKSYMESLKYVVLGPFGFVPTQYGLSPNKSVRSSLYWVDNDSLLSSVLTAHHAEMLTMWEGNIKKTVDTIVSFGNRSIPGDLGSWVDLDLLHDVYSGPIYKSINRDLRSHLVRLIERKPAPVSSREELGLSQKVYQPDEVIKLITNVVKDKSALTVSAIDPFRDTMVDLPLKSSIKSLNFFDKVQRLEAAKGHFIRPKDEIEGSWITAMTDFMRKYIKFRKK